MHQLESVSKPLVALHNVWLPPVETPTKPPSTCEYMHVDISPNWCPLCTSGPSNSEFSIREFKVSWFSIRYSLKSVRSLSYSLKLVHSLSQRFLSQFILYPIEFKVVCVPIAGVDTGLWLTPDFPLVFSRWGKKCVGSKNIFNINGVNAWESHDYRSLTEEVRSIFTIIPY